jgi:hypothetical protein
MPVRKITNTPPVPLAVRLKEQLVQEWKNQASAATEPVILILDDNPEFQHIYVVWSAWHDLHRIERSDIILDAAQEVLGHKPPLNITVAMGLTPREADRLGIKYK